jgi:hypothetical protein
MSEFRLTTGEAHSALWKRLKEHMEERLAALREKNDVTALDPVQTAAVRGQIKELKVLLGMDKPEPAQVAEHGSE